MNRFTRSRFLLIFLPSVTLIGVLVLLFYYHEVRNARRLAEGVQRVHLQLVRQSVDQTLHDAASDLLFLAGLHATQRCAAEQSAEGCGRLQEDFLAYSQEKQIYDQVRYLNAEGKEVVRINLVGGQAVAVPPDQLQDKTGRYYFVDAVHLPRGSIYVSDLDLNIEHGQIEQPLKPVLRLATPVFDAQGHNRGVVVLNYLGRQLTELIRRSEDVTFHGHLMLANREGYWLVGPSATQEWGFMLPERRDSTVQRDYPRAWAKIQAAGMGQFLDDSGLYTFATIDPERAALSPNAYSTATHHNNYWKLISRVPRDELKAGRVGILGGVLLLYAAVALLIGLGALGLARAMDRLRRQRDYTQNLIQGSPALICGLSPEGDVTFTNRAVERITGYRADEMRGRNWWRLVHPGQDETLRQLTQDLARGPVQDNEMELIDRHGERHVVLWNSYHRYDDQGRLLEIVGFGSDVTERRRAESMKREFVSMVSHELRTPLTSIRGALGLVAGEATGTLPPKAKELIDIALRNAKQLINLINDILDLQKLDSGKLVFNPTRQPLMPLIHQALEGNRAFAAQYGVELAIEREVAEVELWVDTGRFAQVMNNLLSNAAKFAPANSCVRVAVEREGDLVRIWVTDSGPGIPESYREHIFETFSQVDSSDARVKGGSGLGLAITRTLIERMGGRIEYESMVGVGSTFCFELPVADSPQQ